jgi:hypothetical protein
MLLTNQQKRDWIDALLSGDYKQGRGSFRRINVKDDAEYGVKGAKTEVQHCCLGVLCEVLGVGDIDEDTGRLNYKGNYAAFQINELENVGLTESLQDKLIELNDGGRDFNYIAGYIEATLPTREY